MKDILNCPQCGKPFHRAGTKQLFCKTCLEQELQMYEFYYQKLTRIVNQLNYHYIGRQANMEETRLRETLSYRLGVGGIDELPSWKRGFCNICAHRLKNMDSTEPVCPSCLDSVVGLVLKDARALLKNDLVDRRPAFSVGTSPASEAPRKTPGTQTDNESGQIENTSFAELGVIDVSKAQYDDAMEKLRLYREHFGELPPEAVPKDHSDLRAVCATPLESNDVLMILAQKDEDVVFDDEELTLLGNAHLYVEGSVSHARHYGFKRGKQAANQMDRRDSND